MSRNTRSRRQRNANNIQELSEDDDSDINMSEEGDDNESGSEYSSESGDNETESEEEESNSDYSPNNGRRPKRRLGRGGSQRGRRGGRGRGARGRGRGSQSQRNRNNNNNDIAANSAEFDQKIIGDVIRYVLMSHNNDRLIKRADLNRTIFEPNNCKQQATRYIDEARQVLLSNWGLDFQPNKDPKSSGTYHLILDNFDSPFCHSGDAELQHRKERKKCQLLNKICNNKDEINAKKGLIFAVVSCIVLQGGVLRQDEFKKIITEQIDTTQFAPSAEKLVQLLSKEKWIVIGKDNEQMEIYTLGIRTLVEFTPPDIYRATCKLVNNRFPNQNDAALQRILNNFESKQNGEDPAKRQLIRSNNERNSGSQRNRNSQRSGNSQNSSQRMSQRGVRRGRRR